MIGENGLGKTSILNALYYTLTCKFNKLSSIVFNKIILEFQSGKFVKIEHEKLDLYSEEEDGHRGRHSEIIISRFNKLYSEKEKNTIIHQINNDEIDYSLLRKLTVRYPPSVVYNVLKKNFSGESGELEKIKTIIKNEIDEEIIYFPTYRRIEEELYNLGLEDGEEKHFIDEKNLLIQFGMGDVKETIDSVLLEIKNSAILGFSSITGQMLRQYVDGLPKKDRKIEPSKLNIILDRVGENITPEYKQSIKDLVESGEISKNEDKYKYLVNFLSNLIKIYEQQEPLDNSIKNFKYVCDAYLINKKVNYNESKVTLNIVQKGDEQIIKLKNLSSGEKQIISLFSKIYLKKSSNLIILFDEPELSLSMEWQQKLLPDILKSGKCNLLFAVTHSPFIFNNELDMIAEDMKKLFK